MNFKPIYYTQQERGKKIPSSKRRYLWIFQINNQSHQLQLFCSFISNKRVVVLDNIRVHESRNFTFSFEWKYELQGHKLQIIQQLSIFPLLVNNLDFIVMLQQLGFKQNNMFAKNQNQYFQQNLQNNTQLDLQSNANTISNITMSDFQSMSERVKKWTSYKPKLSQNQQQLFDIPFSGQDPYKDMILLLDEDSQDQVPYLIKQSQKQRRKQLI